MAIADRLRDRELFAHFSADQLSALEECVSVVRYPRGVTVVREGDESYEAYFVDRGQVRIERQTGYGSYPLATLSAGEMFGETSFLDRRGRSGDAVADGPDDEIELIALHPVPLAARLEADRQLAVSLHWTFWKSLSAKLRSTNDRLTEFFRDSAGAANPPAASDPAAEDFHVDLEAKRRLFSEQKLSRLEINFLTSLSRERKLAPDEVLFREGDPGDAMYVVLDGRVMISKHIPGAGEEALAFLERGEYFGEMALIDQRPRSADAKADDKGAVVLAMPRDVVSGLLDLGKTSSLPLLEILCSMTAQRLRELDDKLVTWFILAGGGV